MIQLLGNCSNRSAYEYTEKDVADIFGAIEKELKLARQKYSSSDEKLHKFKLKK